MALTLSQTKRVDINFYMKEKLLKSFNTNNENETYEIGVEFGKSLVGGETILMYGQAGAGKTVFTKGIAHALGISECVTSPTFALKNEYNGKFDLHHLDMYRIESMEEAFESGALDEISDEGAVTIVEWAENVIEFFDFPHIKIYIDYVDAHKREIRIIKSE